jgi:polysaccharide export outer membrane protein
MLVSTCIFSYGSAWGQQDAGPNSQPTVEQQIVRGGVEQDSMASAHSPNDEFLIGNEDLLAVNVWKEPEISRAIPVRTDGRISLPLVGELEAKGHTARQLQDEITKKLKAYLSNPEVTVIVQEIRSQRFNILGQVARPGSYPLSKPMTVLDAIAVAGGVGEFAKLGGIYVLRRDLDGITSRRIPFNYKQVIKNKRLEQNVELEARDTIVVP